jgi:hypothetical protein
VDNFTADIGLPFYDPTDDRKLWALGWDAANSRYGSLKFTEDYGRSWTTWISIPPYANSSTLAMDSAGNFYFAQSTGLYKVTRATQTIALVITWDAAYNPHSWLSWAWGEDAAGNLYTSAYTLVGTGGQFVWKCTAGSWSKLTVLSDDYPNCRHVHSLHVNPYNDNIYVCWGDDVTTRGMGVSDDGFATVTQITESTHPGPTGITFTSEAVWTTTDLTGGTANELKSISDDTTSVIRYTAVSPYAASPFYFCRAIEGNPNEMWIVGYNELAAATSPVVMKLTKAAGVTSAWSVDLMYAGDNSYANGYSMYQIAAGLNGVIPATSPYVFVERIGDKGVFRLPRAILTTNNWRQ